MQWDEACSLEDGLKKEKNSKVRDKLRIMILSKKDISKRKQRK